MSENAFFVIHQRNAERIYNVVGDIHRGVTEASLPTRTRGQALRDVAEIDAELRCERPDRSYISRLLERLTRLLIDRGALAGGTALVASITALAEWLGPFGTTVLALLA